jgi:ankyrin repeat protein
MSDVRPLPDRPDLRRLRDEAKQRKRAGEFDSLAAAQLTVAREHGFASWPRLKTYVETRALDRSERAAALVRSACSSDLRTARTLLDAEPELARLDLATACATGEVADVRRRLDRDPASVGRRTGPNAWEPILYATFSRLLRADPVRADGIVEIVRRLLDAGADPNVMFMDDEFRQLPVFGAAGIANHAELTRMLLEAGADPNETYETDQIGEALYHAAEFPDPTCARLLIEAGTTRPRVSYCLGRAIDFPNAAMIEMFLAHGAEPTGAQLRKAVMFWRPIATIRALVDAGAPVDRADEEGFTPLRLAVRSGQDDVAELLVERGADAAQVTDTDRRSGSVLNGADPAAPNAGGAPEAELLEWAAHVGDAESVRRLLAAGAPVDGTPDHRPLSTSAWRGHAEVVRTLVDAGAALEWDDGSGIGAALHGARHCQHPQGGPTMGTEDEIVHGDYPGVLRILVDTGAPVPAYIWERNLDAVDRFAGFGIDVAPPATG